MGRQEASSVNREVLIKDLSSEGDICMTPLPLKDQDGPLQVTMATRGPSLPWPREVGKKQI